MHLVKEAQNRYVGQISAPEIFFRTKEKIQSKSSNIGPRILEGLGKLWKSGEAIGVKMF